MRTIRKHGVFIVLFLIAGAAFAAVTEYVSGPNETPVSVSAGRPLPVTGTQVSTPVAGTLADHSGTTTLGGTSQQAIASNTSRRYLFVQNPCSNSESVWIRIGASATTASPSIEIAPCADLEFNTFIPTGAVNITSATTSTAWTVKEGID